MKTYDDGDFDLPYFGLIPEQPSCPMCPNNVVCHMCGNPEHEYHCTVCTIPLCSACVVSGADGVPVCRDCWKNGN